MKKRDCIIEIVQPDSSQANRSHHQRPSHCRGDKRWQELFARYKLRQAFLTNSLVIVKNPQRGESPQKLVGLQQVHRMTGTAGKSLLISGVGLINQKSVRSKRRNQSREEFTVKIKENQYQVVLLMP